MDRSEVSVVEVARRPCRRGRGAREAIEADHDTLHDRLAWREVDGRHDDDRTAARADDRMHRGADGQRRETALPTPAQNHDVSVAVGRRLHDRRRRMALTEDDAIEAIIVGGTVVSAHRDVHDRHVCVMFACEPCRPRDGSGGRTRAVIAYQDEAHDVPPFRSIECRAGGSLFA
jgi:hypothetical protein